MHISPCCNRCVQEHFVRVRRFENRANRANRADPNMAVASPARRSLRASQRRSASRPSGEPAGETRELLPLLNPPGRRRRASHALITGPAESHIGGRVGVTGDEGISGGWRARVRAFIPPARPGVPFTRWPTHAPQRALQGLGDYLTVAARLNGERAAAFPATPSADRAGVYHRRPRSRS